MSSYGPADIALLVSVCRDVLGLQTLRLDTPIDDEQGTRLLAAAVDHGLTGQLADASARLAFLPEQTMVSARGAFLAQATRNLQLVSALREIVTAFSSAGIESAILKGPAVAILAYNQVLQREFTDLDLLVRPDDLARARSILTDLGFGLASADTLGNADEKDVEYFRDSDKAYVELHWAINPPNSRFPLEATGIWERLQTISLFDSPIRTLSLEDTLICLCIHAAKHHWTNLKWTFDIAQMLKSKADSLDWAVIEKRCDAVGCMRTLLFGLQLTKIVFGCPLPQSVAGWLWTNESLRNLAEVVKRSLLQGASLAEADLMKCRIAIHDRFRDRIFVAARPYPDLPRFLPDAAKPITNGPLRFVTRPARFLYVYGFDWVRTVILGR